MSFQLLPKKLPPTQWLKNTRLLVHSSVGQKPGGLDHVLCIGSHEVRINVLARLCSYWRFCRIDFQSYLVIGRTRFYVIIVLRSPYLPGSWLGITLNSQKPHPGLFPWPPISSSQNGIPVLRVSVTYPSAFKGLM